MLIETWACNSRWNPVTFTWAVSNNDCNHKLCLLSLFARWDYSSVCALHDIRHTNPFQLIVSIIPCPLVVMNSLLYFHHQLYNNIIHFMCMLELFFILPCCLQTFLLTILCVLVLLFDV